MKEMGGQNNLGPKDLTNMRSNAYSYGGDKIMSENQAKNDTSVAEATLRLDRAAKAGERRRATGVALAPEEASLDGDSRPENEGQLQGGPAAEANFGKQFKGLTKAVSTPEFQAILAKISMYGEKGLENPQLLQQLYSELGEAYSESYKRMFTQIEDLSREKELILSTSAPKTEVEKNKLVARKDALESSLAQMREAIGSADGERRAIQQLLISRVNVVSEANPDAELLVDKILKAYKEKIREGVPREQKTQTEAEIKTWAIELLEKLPPAEHRDLPDDVLKAIGRDEAATEKFISRLIASHKEDDPYQMNGFYGAINLDVFLKVNQDISAERMDRLQNLIQANQAFHNMNYIIKRSFDQFVDQSKALLPKHFDTVMRIPGVASVFRAYERYYKEELGTETRITEGPLSRTEGVDQQEKGIELRVKEEFEERMKKRTLKLKGYVEEDQLEPWEIDRAIVYGRNLYRISVRAAEVISQSELHSGMEQFISAPQKELTQLIDPLKFITFRFKPNETRGGIELAEEIRRKRKDKRQKDGKVRLQVLEGIDTDNRSMQDIISARGYIETWRLGYGLMREVAFMDGEKQTNVMQFLKDHGEEMRRFKEWGMKGGEGWRREHKRGARVNESLESFKQRRVSEVLKPLIDNNNIALGALVSGFGSDVPLPTEAKQLLWEKIADLNPNAMATFLTRVEVDKRARGAEKLLGENGVKSLEKILFKHFGSPDASVLVNASGEWLPLKLKEEIGTLEKEKGKIKGKISQGTATEKEMRDLDGITKNLQAKKLKYEEADAAVKRLLRNDRWKNLKDKFEIINEIRLQDEMKRIEAIKRGELPEDSKAFSEYLKDAGIEGKELEVYKDIAGNGKKISGDLAHMKQVTTWFLDDAPLEKARWIELGQTFDRQTNDLANFHKGSAKLLEYLFDPFARPSEEMIKTLREAMDGTAGILGLEAAQQNMREFFPQYLEMIQRTGIGRQLLIGWGLEAFHKPTSRAQVITGSMDSPSIGEDETFKLAQKALHAGIARPEVRDKDTGELLHESTYDDLKNNKALHLAWYKRLLEANARDYGPAFLLVLLIKIMQGTYSQVVKDNQ